MPWRVVPTGSGPRSRGLSAAVPCFDARPGVASERRPGRASDRGQPPECRGDRESAHEQPGESNSPACLLVHAHEPASSSQPMHDAMVLAHHDQAAKSPANQQANAAFDMMLTAQGQAAQQTSRSGSSSSVFARQFAARGKTGDGRSVGRVDQSGYQSVQRTALPVLQGITGMSLGRRAREVEGVVDRPARIRLPIGCARNQAHLHRFCYHQSPLPTNSCFAAGTMVQTMDGPRAIESIRTGDVVLSQDTTTGAAGVSTGADRTSQPAGSTLTDQGRR